MKKSLTSIELSYVMKELSELKGAKLDKAFNPSRETIILQLHIAGQGKKLLRIEIPKFIYISEYKEKNPDKISDFCSTLRKFLNQSRIREIRQIGSERIIEILFEKKEKFRLFIELFSPGNAILCREDLTIINALEKKKWKERTVRGGIKYEWPQRDFTFFSISKKKLLQIFAETKLDTAVTCLALDIGLGGVYAEEACLIAGIDKSKKPSDLNEKNAEKIEKAIQAMCSMKPKPNAAYEKNEIKDITPFELKLYSSLELKHFPSYNEALNSSLTPQIEEKEHTEAQTKKDKSLNKLKKIISDQQDHIKTLEKEISENQAKAEAIYNNYMLISDILSQILKAREKHSWAEIRKKLKGHKIIKSIDEKQGKIVIEI